MSPFCKSKLAQNVPCNALAWLTLEARSRKRLLRTWATSPEFLQQNDPCWHWFSIVSIKFTVFISPGVLVSHNINKQEIKNSSNPKDLQIEDVEHAEPPGMALQHAKFSLLPQEDCAWLTVVDPEDPVDP